MILFSYILSVICFTMAFFISKLALSFGEVMSITNEAMRVIRDTQITDLEKESRTQKSALMLFRMVLVITVKSVAVVLITMIPMFLADFLWGIPFNDIVNFSLRLDVLLITAVVMLAVWAAFKVFRKSPAN